MTAAGAAGAGAIELVVLGAGPAYTDRPGSSGAAYLIRHPGWRDPARPWPGLVPATGGELEPSTLSAILVSHLHPDHFVDLVPLRHYLRWHLSPSRRVRVIGPAGLASGWTASTRSLGSVRGALDIEALTEGSTAIAPFTVEAGLVAHTDESYGFRVAVGDGPGLVYSGDCGRAEDLDALIRPGDMLLSEVSFGAGPVPADAAHLAGPEVGRLATRTGVRVGPA